MSDLRAHPETIAPHLGARAPRVGVPVLAALTATLKEAATRRRA
jgi:hypothetical protein